MHRVNKSRHGLAVMGCEQRHALQQLCLSSHSTQGTILADISVEDTTGLTWPSAARPFLIQASQVLGCFLNHSSGAGCKG